MFKRVEKRRKRKQEEEELGLDEDIKDVLGLQDTDSDESESDYDTNSDPSVSPVKSEDETETFPSTDFGGEFLDEKERSDDGEAAAISVQEALRDPVYLISLQPYVRECIVCPGKLLKGTKMVELHRASNAHERRFKRFKKLVAGANPNANAWNILRENSGEKTREIAGLSKRAEKRKEHKAMLKASREERKVNAKARKTRTPHLSSDSVRALPGQSKKKRKVQDSSITLIVKQNSKVTAGVLPSATAHTATTERKPPEATINGTDRTSDHARETKLRTVARHSFAV